MHCSKSKIKEIKQHIKSLKSKNILVLSVRKTKIMKTTHPIVGYNSMRLRAVIIPDRLSQRKI